MGATPVFVDVEEGSFNLDPQSLARAIPVARKAGLTPKAVIPVDLFGQPADHAAIAAIAEAEKLFVLDDAAQAFGATYRNRRIGTLGHATAPASSRPSRSAATATAARSSPTTTSSREILRSMRVHGEGRGKYDCVRIGLNGRFDTIQAAVLIEKLKIFPDEIAARERIAARYRRRSRTSPRSRASPTARPRSGRNTPSALRRSRREAFAADAEGARHPDRDPLSQAGARPGAPTGTTRSPKAALPVSERLAKEVISLPMHAYLEEPVQDRIIAAVRRALGA